MKERLQVSAFRLTADQTSGLTRVLTYDRVSTYRQVGSEEDLDSLKKQDAASQCFIEGKAESEGWDLVGRVTDEAKSGDDPKRKGINDILILARLRLFNILVVFAQDRLARDWATIKAVIEELERYDVQVYTASGARITLSSLEGTIHAMTMALITEMTLATVRFGKTKDTANTISAGHWLGGRTPMGFKAVVIEGRKKRKKDLHHCPINGPIWIDILDRLAIGERAGDILEYARKKGYRTPSIIKAVDGVSIENGNKPIEVKHIESVLKNPIYGGYLQLKKYKKAVASSGQGIPPPKRFLSDDIALYEFHGKGLVPFEKWEKGRLNYYGRNRSYRKPRKADTEGKFLLQGIAKCGCCKRTMTTRGTNGTRSYVCMNHYQAYKYNKISQKCLLKGLPASVAEAAVLRLFSKIVTHSDIITKVVTASEPAKPDTVNHAAIIRADLKGKHLETERLVDALIADPERVARKVIEAKLNELSREINLLDSQLDDVLSADPDCARSRNRIINIARSIFIEHDKHRELARQEIKALLQAALAGVIFNLGKTEKSSSTRIVIVQLSLKYDQLGRDSGVKIPVVMKIETKPRSRTFKIIEPFTETCSANDVISIKSVATTPIMAFQLLDEYEDELNNMRRCDLAKKLGRTRSHITQVLELKLIPRGVRKQIERAPACSQHIFTQNRLRQLAKLLPEEMERKVGNWLSGAN